MKNKILFGTMLALLLVGSVSFADDDADKKRLLEEYDKMQAEKAKEQPQTVTEVVGETNIVQKGELQEEVIAKIQQARPAERWGERPKQGRHAFTTRIRHCGPPTARDFYTPWYKTVLRAFTPSQGTAGQRSFVPVRTAARPMDLIAWKRVLDGRTMSGYSNCIEYLIERQSTFAMWKFAACVSALLAFRR